MYSHYMDEEAEAQRQTQRFRGCTARSGLSLVCQCGEGHHRCHTLDSTFWGSFGTQAPLSLRHLSLWYVSTLRRSCGHNDGGPPRVQRLFPDAVICDFLFSCLFYENIYFVIPYQMKSTLPREPSNHAFLEALINEALCLPLF